MEFGRDEEVAAREGLAIRTGLVVVAADRSILLAHEANATASGERMTRVEHVLAPVAADMSPATLPAPVAWPPAVLERCASGSPRIPAGEASCPNPSGGFGNCNRTPSSNFGHQPVWSR